MDSLTCDAATKNVSEAVGKISFSLHLIILPIQIQLATRPVWHGVTMDSLKFHPGLPGPTLLSPAGGPPPKQPNSLTAIFGVARPQGWLPAAVFYPLGYLTLYGPAGHHF
jgi:hypothetical protein